jgi:hypothetical protein
VGDIGQFGAGCHRRMVLPDLSAASGPTPGGR